jgi:hypothetical protein
MRYNKFLPLALLVVVLAVAQGATAQEHKHVEVTTLYNPEVAAATKLVAPASVADSSELETEIEYGINTNTWQLKLTDHYFKPAAASYWDFDRAKHFYARLGGGYPLGSEATLRYMTQNVRLGYFGVGVTHDGGYAPKCSALGVERLGAHSYDLRNELSLIGGVFVGCQMLEVDASYDFDIYNRYAEVAETPDRLYFHDGDIVVRYGDSFADLHRLNFGIELRGGYWRHAYNTGTCRVSPVPEFNGGGSVRLARAFNRSVVEVRAGYDMWQQLSTSYRDMRFDVQVGYRRGFGFVDLEASLGYMYDRVRDRAKASHFVMPGVKAMFNFGLEAVVPYVELATTVSQNGVASLCAQNPYLDFVAMKDRLLTMPNTRNYDLSLGAVGSVAHERLSYRAYVGANFMRDQVVWYVLDNGNFGVDTGDNNRIFFGVELDYAPVGGLVLSARYRMHADNSTAKYAVDAARMSGEFKVEYMLKRWKFYVLGDLMGSRRWSSELMVNGEGSTVFKSPTTLDLRAGVSFKASRSVEVYADGYNLLNSTIYDYAYYYRNGVGFMAGVKIDF